MSELVFLFSADADIQAAYEYYEAVQAGRGEVFMRHLDVALASSARFRSLHRYFTDRIAGYSSTASHSAYSTRSRVVA